MEGQSERLRQSSDDMIESNSKYQGLERILVFKRVLVNGAVAWEFDVVLTEKRNGCTFEEKTKECWCSGYSL